MAGSIINTFDKGMHQDSAFILQPDGTYRNMKNGMLISYDGNHYTIEMSKGNVVKLSIPENYLPANNGTATLKDTAPMPIGFISFLDKLVVFTTNNEDVNSGGYGEIGLIRFERLGAGFLSFYTPYYNHKSLNFTKAHKIEGFTFEENDSIKRVYWTDNLNEPRVFDFANPIFSNHFSGVGDLVVGKKYMVVGGVITHNGFRYGPSGGTNIPTAPNYINDNVFTAANTNFTIFADSPVVTEYYPLELLNWTPNRLLGNINFKQYGVGSVDVGSKIYFYRLSSTVDGFVTSWSYASSPIHVGMSNNQSAVNAYGTPYSYHDFAGNGSISTIVNSGKSVEIDISDISTIYDTIELAVAEFDQDKDVPYRISIVAKDTITGSSMTLTHNGNSNFGTVTISDLTLFPASILKVKTLSTNKNYNIIANITEREEFDLDLSTVSINSFEYPLITHGDNDLCVNNLTYDPHSPVTGANPGATTILPWSRYLVTDISGGDITYDGNAYTLGDVFVGVVGQTSATIPVGSECRPCATVNRYTKINGGTRTENAIELKTAFWDYKDPSVASHNRGYWSAEKYRIGILFYDLKGNPYYVKWINDFTMPDISTKGGLIRSDAYTVGGETEVYSLNPSGLILSGLEIPKDIVEQISGFSIVRAERDKRILTQGLVLQLTSNGGALTPIAALDPTQNYDPLDQSGFLIYLCPDNNNNSIKTSSAVGGSDFGVVGDFMEEAAWLSPYSYAANTYLRADIFDTNSVSKMFVPLAHDTVNAGAAMRKVELASVNSNTVLYGPNEGGTDPNFDGAGGVFTNQIRTNLVAGPLIDSATCSVGALATLTNRNSVGCKKLLFRISSSMFKHYGVSDLYYDTVPRYEKILMNYVKNFDASSQYGGTGDSAIANTLYISTGHFQPITSQVIIDNNDTNDINTYTKLTFNDIEVFGGDCYTNLIDLTYGLFDTTLANPFSYTLYFPCECNSNHNLRRGRTASRVGTSNGVSYTNGIMFNDGTAATPRLEDFSYNNGYTTEGLFVKYPALPAFYKFTGNFKYRIRWSPQKFPGELINSFRTFRTPDYRDVDGQRGQINNLKAKDSKLFYWQDHGVGYVPILERQLVGGGALGDATALGVTGVIDRYDDIDTYFGNQHQHGLTETEYGFAWFDMRKRAFLVMGVGSKPEEISLIKGLQVFFNSQFNEGRNSVNRIYNTNDLSILEKPLLGYGIIGVYDPQFKMTYLTFKYDDKLYNSATTDIDSVITKDFTLGYSHVLNAIVGFFDNCPAIWHNHNDLVLSSNNGKFTQQYGDDMPFDVSYIVGDTVRVLDTEYICILPVTIAAYPGTLTPITGTNPLAPSSQYWAAINKQNQIYLNNYGDICSFYGKVWSHDLEVIVNAKSDVAVTPQNIQFKAIGGNWTSLIATTENQSSSDLNISTTNRNYRFIDGSWFSSIPLDKAKGRLTDYYVKLSFSFSNYVTDPRVSKNIQKVSQWLKTFFVNKR